MIKQNNLNPNSICEIGCGAGEILHQLYMQMEKTVLFFGYEISPYAFELCKQRQEERLRFKLENIFDTSSFFDVIMAIDVIEHIEDYWGFFEKTEK
jgi:cyclopropane fatty-acyl-phospholipid synthase-like methyltransferase